jgi:hypothetical protein
MPRLDRSKLIPTFSEEFDRPLSFWDRRTRQGRWKTNWFYGDQSGPSSRVSNDEIAVDYPYCGINPFGLWGDEAHIQLSRTKSKDPRLGGKSLVTGILTTERSFSQLYGYFECRFAAPNAPGCWPSFWLYDAPVRDLTGKQWDNGLGFGREWTGGLTNELDVVEILTNNPRETHHTASARGRWLDGRPGTGPDPEFKPLSKSHAVPSNGATWAHAYGAAWTGEEVIWYVDDAEVARMPNPGLHSPMYMIVSMGAGGWNGNALSPEFTLAQMRLEYVRAYRLA